MKKALKVLSLLFSVMLLCVGVVGCEQSENIDENIQKELTIKTLCKQFNISKNKL